MQQWIRCPRLLFLLVLWEADGSVLGEEWRFTMNLGGMLAHVFRVSTFITTWGPAGRETLTTENCGATPDQHQSHGPQVQVYTTSFV